MKKIVFKLIFSKRWDVCAQLKLRPGVEKNGVLIGLKLLLVSLKRKKVNWKVKLQFTLCKKFLKFEGKGACESERTKEQESEKLRD